MAKLFYRVLFGSQIEDGGGEALMKVMPCLEIRRPLNKNSLEGGCYHR